MTASTGLSPICRGQMFGVRRPAQAGGTRTRNSASLPGRRSSLKTYDYCDYAGAYLAGIECDGATYHSSATARDRDKVRQQVLTGLDWKQAGRRTQRTTRRPATAKPGEEQETPAAVAAPSGTVPSETAASTEGES